VPAGGVKLEIAAQCGHVTSQGNACRHYFLFLWIFHSDEEEGRGKGDALAKGLWLEKFDL